MSIQQYAFLKYIHFNLSEKDSHIDETLYLPAGVLLVYWICMAHMSGIKLKLC